MSTWVWVLTFTVLGTPPEHHESSKYLSKTECFEALESLRQGYKQKKKQISGTCKLVLKSTK